MRIINKVKYYISKSQRRNDLENILKSIDLEKFNFYKDKYKNTSPYPGSSKYLNIEEWMEDKILEVYRLGLNKSLKLDILDIGTGAGYFPYVCNYYGHNSRALDLETTPMYNDIIKLLNINRKNYEIKSYEKLPDMGIKFDLITAFAICFNNHDTSEVWNINEWDFFFKGFSKKSIKRKWKGLFDSKS